MKTAQELFDKNFTNNTTRDPRSAAYKRGALDMLQKKLHGQDYSIPFAAGTAERDAYFAGGEEGMRIAKAEQMFNKPVKASHSLNELVALCDSTAPAPKDANYE